MFSTNHIHPMLVHFPVALVIIGFLAETLSMLVKKEPCLTKTGYYLLVVGALSALVAYLSGQFFTPEMDGSAGKIREQHELVALLTVASLVINAFYRSYLLAKKKRRESL